MLTTSFEEDGYSLGVCICEKKGRRNIQVIGQFRLKTFERKNKENRK